MTVLEAPQEPPTWTHKPEDVLDLTKTKISHVKAILDQVAALREHECNFDSVFRKLAEAEASLFDLEPLLFYRYVSPDEELRDASSEAAGLVCYFNVEADMRLDVFIAKKQAEANFKSQNKKLSGEEQRLVDKMILQGHRAGLDLPENERTKLTELKKEVLHLCGEFRSNIREESGKIYFTQEELKGVPSDVVSGYERREKGSEKLFGVTHKDPDIDPVFKYAQIPETRRRAMQSYEARLEINTPLLSQILEIRRELASMLGYSTWADFITEEKMVKSAKGVTDFLDDIERKMRPVGNKDREMLLALKQKECEELGIPFDGDFNFWDYSYYKRKFIEEMFALDDSKVKEYFPVTVVVPAVLDIFQTLLGVRFEEMKQELWHQDVQVFRVWEADAKEESQFIGYCYLDLYPREAKFSHDSVWDLLPGYELSDGKRNYPVVAMVAVLAKLTPERPALMRHDDVVTFFHEMGHVFHKLLSRTQFARFNATSVAMDFMEAPSQMFENWCWEPLMLKKMSSHYHTKDPLPNALIEKIIQSRYANNGLFYLRQLFFAKFDINVHSGKVPTDLTKYWNDLRESVSLVKNDPDLKAGQGSFAHIVRGYDAGYYGYMYSLVFSADMYATIFKKNPLDPELGSRYRKEILNPGGSRDETESLEAFLGRPPNSDAFMKELFGSTCKWTAQF